MTNSLCPRCREISRCQVEQICCASAIREGNSGPGAFTLGLADWTLEELLLAETPCSCKSYREAPGPPCPTCGCSLTEPSDSLPSSRWCWPCKAHYPVPGPKPSPTYSPL